MRKLNFEEYLNLANDGTIENPLELYNYLKEDGDPDIDSVSEDNVSEFIKKITEYLSNPISFAQKMAISITIAFGIPYDQVLALPFEVGMYLLMQNQAKQKELQPKPKSIGDQIQDAKLQMGKGNGNGMNVNQIAAIFQALQGNNG
jgi:hypothetical protein